MDIGAKHDVREDLHIFVCVHDAGLIQQIDPQLRTAANAPFTYLFVGARSANPVRDWPNVVVARDLADQIEDQHKFVDFTAWYAIARNGLSHHARNVALIQYDTVITPKFAVRTVQKMAASPGRVLGYVPWPMSNANFLKNNMGAEPLARSVAVVYGVDIGDLVAQAIAAGDDLWPSANSFCLSPDHLDRFVAWFVPLMPHIGNIDAAGHSLERAVKIFCLMEGISCLYDASVARHFQLNSHGSQSFSAAMVTTAQRRFAGALQASPLSRFLRSLWR